MHIYTFLNRPGSQPNSNFRFVAGAATLLSRVNYNMLDAAGPHLHLLIICILSVRWRRALIFRNRKFIVCVCS